MTSEAAIPYQVDTGMMGGRIRVHVHLPEHENATDYHWYVNLDAARAQTEENPVFDVESAAKFFGEFGVGLNRRTVDRITRMIDFDIIHEEPAEPTAGETPEAGEKDQEPDE